MNYISREEFLSSISCIAESVYDFHERFSIPPLSSNGSSEHALERLRKRLAFLVEEVGEHSKELNQGDLSEASLELADVAFVAIGTLLELDSIGADACVTVASKNNGKTHDTHMMEATSGKLVKKVSPQ